jgi:8-oxo-dGTP pyrophosphatase MutT (NUDIX family)
MSETREAPHASATPAARPGLRPRDAATLVLVDRTGRAPRVLMGRRRPDQVFLPDTFVFPGGRVEAADRRFARHHALPPHEAQCLKVAMRGRASDARAAALPLAAIRETFEETGFVVGEPGRRDSPANDTGWAGFVAQGFRPRLTGLAFFARAITPPGRPRRYDTRFFLADASEIAHRAERIDGELLDIDWFTLEQARALKLPSITRHVIEDIAALLSEPRTRPGARGVPFYVHSYGRLERRLLPRTMSPLEA